MTNRHGITVILLAAGASSRMHGRDKLLEDVNGIPLLRHVAARALASTAAGTLVVLGAKATARTDALRPLPLNFVTNTDWESGMASSLRTGVAALPENTDGAIILLGDMPDVTTALLDALIAKFYPESGFDIVRPVSASGPVGNPVLFGRRHFPALMALTGDTGAKPVIAANPDSVVDVQAADDGVLTDLDTPEAWSAWRAKQ